MMQYYSLLKATLEEYSVLNCPNQIYHIDESGILLDHKSPKVIARKETKKSHCCTSGNKAQTTVIVCANTAGSTLPPMIIFDGQCFNNPEWSKGEVLNTLYGISDKGWRDQELFFY